MQSESVALRNLLSCSVGQGGLCVHSTYRRVQSESVALKNLVSCCEGQGGLCVHSSYRRVVKSLWLREIFYRVVWDREIFMFTVATEESQGLWLREILSYFVGQGGLRVHSSYRRVI